MHDKEEYDRLNFLGSMDNSTHPNYNQRIDRAKKSGFTLSKGGQQQIDALQQHLAWPKVGIKADADAIGHAHILACFML